MIAYTNEPISAGQQAVDVDAGGHVGDDDERQDLEHQHEDRDEDQRARCDEHQHDRSDDRVEERHAA